ncbi:MAG TPA: hypothetical protein ENK56_06185 [Chloroflexi bacterium]|nr:hypothetical protein [Chloroflexota bacterium]
MDSRTDRLILVTMVLTVLEVSLAGLVLRRPWAFSFIAWQMVLTYLVYTGLTRNRLLVRLLVLPLFADLVQLLTDWYHARVVETLVYDYALFRIWETPDYIIAGWGFAFLQLGYLTLWLKRRIGLWPAIGLVTVVGSILHTWYEEMAYQAHAWRYINASLLAHVSHWVILTFVALIASLCVIVAWLEKRPVRDWALGGLLVGALIFVYSAIAVALFRYVG